MTQAVLAIEDRRFYEHPGVDPIGIVGAVVLEPARQRSAYSPAAARSRSSSSRNVFLPKFAGHDAAGARARSRSGASCSRSGSSLVLDARASKDEILEMYLNDMPLGQRGSFAIVGVPEAARLFFGKDVSNVTLAEAATIAGVIQSPSALSPFNNPERCKRAPQRRAAGDGRRRLHHARRPPTRASHEPLSVVAARARSRGAVLRRLRRRRRSTEQYPGLTTTTTRRSTSTRRSTCTCSGSRRTPCATA